MVIIRWPIVCGNVIAFPILVAECARCQCHFVGFIDLLESLPVTTKVTGKKKKKIWLKAVVSQARAPAAWWLPPS